MDKMQLEASICSAKTEVITKGPKDKSVKKDLSISVKI